MIRFDESLVVLASVVSEELGAAQLESGLVVRDISGRLAFFSAVGLKKNKRAALEKRLSKELGVYGRSDRILADVDEFGVQSLFDEAAWSKIPVKDWKIRLLDRRLVGADWLRPPTDNISSTLSIVFASIKGGVGRSTALSVVAADQAARGRRVLAIDLDMEAPGIGAMLLDLATTPRFGTIDALLESALVPLDAAFLSDLVGPSSLAERNGKIDVIPAFGATSIENPGDVLAKISRAYGDSIDASGHINTLADRVRSLVDQFADSGNYDVILIDARAGLHETTAASIVGLGAEVLLFGLDEPQTFLGYSALLSHMVRFFGRSSALSSWRDRLTMVQGKSTGSDSEEFSEKCKELFSNVGLSSAPTPNFEEVQLPADPFNNVPWDDAEISIESVVSESNFVNVEIIYDDSNFSGFNPTRRTDLLTNPAYAAAFGSFVASVNHMVESALLVKKK